MTRPALQRRLFLVASDGEPLNQTHSGLGFTSSISTMTKPYFSVATLSPISPVSPAVPFFGAVDSLPRLRGLASASGPFLAVVSALAWGSSPAPLVQAPKFSAAFEEVYAGLHSPPPLPSVVRGGPAPPGGLPRGRVCLGSGCPGPAVGAAGCLCRGHVPPVQ